MIVLKVLAIWCVIGGFVALVLCAFLSWSKSVTTPQPGQFDYVDPEADWFDARFIAIVRAESQREHPSQRDPS